MEGKAKYAHVIKELEDRMVSYSEKKVTVLEEDRVREIVQVSMKPFIEIMEMLCKKTKKVKNKTESVDERIQDLDAVIADLVERQRIDHKSMDGDLRVIKATQTETYNLLEKQNRYSVQHFAEVEAMIERLDDAIEHIIERLESPAKPEQISAMLDCVQKAVEERQQKIEAEEGKSLVQLLGEKKETREMTEEERKEVAELQAKIDANPPKLPNPDLTLEPQILSVDHVVKAEPAKVEVVKPKSWFW